MYVQQLVMVQNLLKLQLKTNLNQYCQRNGKNIHIISIVVISIRAV